MASSSKNQATNLGVRPKEAHLGKQLNIGFFRARIISIVLLILFPTTYSIYWFIVAANLETHLLNEIQEYFGKEIQISSGQIQVEGFPTNFRINFSNLGLRKTISYSSEIAPMWRWEIDNTIVQIKPWDFSKFQIDLTGNHKVFLKTTTTRQHFTGSANNLVVELKRLVDGRLESIELQARQLQFSSKHRKGATNLQHVNIITKRLFPNNVSTKTPTLKVKIVAENLSLSGLTAFPLGNTIKSINATAQVIGELSWPSKIDGLRKWRDEGGVVEIEIADASYGPLHSEASGTISLDENLQVLAAVSAKVRGFSAAIDRLVESQVIEPNVAKLAIGLLSGLSGSDPDTTPVVINLPLTVQDNKLSIYQIELMNIPEIVWRGG